MKSLKQTKWLCFVFFSFFLSVMENYCLEECNICMYILNLFLIKEKPGKQFVIVEGSNLLLNIKLCGSCFLKIK